MTQLSVPDTGYTGIKQYMSGKTLVKEVTFKNGVREGLMKSFYQTGEVRQTFWYEKWFKRRFLNVVLPGRADLPGHSL